MGIFNTAVLPPSLSLNWAGIEEPSKQSMPSNRGLSCVKQDMWPPLEVPRGKVLRQKCVGNGISPCARTILHYSSECINQVPVADCSITKGIKGSRIKIFILFLQMTKSLARLILYQPVSLPASRKLWQQVVNWAK